MFVSLTVPSNFRTDDRNVVSHGEAVDLNTSFSPPATRETPESYAQRLNQDFEGLSFTPRQFARQDAALAA